MVQKVDSLMGDWMGCGSMLSHCVTFYFGSAKVCSPDIIETNFSYDKDIWIAVANYYMYFYLIVLFLLAPILQIINFIDIGINS